MNWPTNQQTYWLGSIGITILNVVPPQDHELCIRSRVASRTALGILGVAEMSDFGCLPLNPIVNDGQFPFWINQVSQKSRIPRLTSTRRDSLDALSQIIWTKPLLVGVCSVPERQDTPRMLCE
jgi:hypothetical protein